MEAEVQRRRKDKIYEQLERIGKSVASQRRIELLDLLAQGERNVETLAKETGLSVANTSRHLQVLREARLVESDRQGPYVQYKLADPAVFDLVEVLRALAERRLAEFEKVVEDYLGLE